MVKILSWGGADGFRPRNEGGRVIWWRPGHDGQGKRWYRGRTPAPLDSARPVRQRGPRRRLRV